MQSFLLIIAICILALLLLLTIAVLVWYSGFLDDITVSAGKPPCQNLKVVYKFGRGAYKDVGAVFTEVTCISPSSKCFAIYYDDPKQIAVDKLRWVVGSVLAEGQEDPDPLLLQAFTKEGFKCFHFPKVNNAVTTSFPYRSQLSVFVGIYRVYPELARYIRQMKLCAHPFVEVYAGDKIHYYAPLSKQEGFYVPESDPHYINPNLVAWDTGSTAPPVPNDVPMEGSSLMAEKKGGKVDVIKDLPDKDGILVKQNPGKQEIAGPRTDPSEGDASPGEGSQVVSDAGDAPSTATAPRSRSPKAAPPNPAENVVDSELQTNLDEGSRSGVPRKSKTLKSSSAPPYPSTCSSGSGSKVEMVNKPELDLSPGSCSGNSRPPATSEKTSSFPMVQDSGITSTTSMTRGTSEDTETKKLSEISPSNSFSDDDLPMSMNSFMSGSSFLSNSESQYSNYSLSDGSKSGSLDLSDTMSDASQSRL